MTAPVQARSAVGTPGRPSSPPPPIALDAARETRRLERSSAMARLEFVLEELSVRYAELGLAVVRQQAVEVLCLGAPDRLTPTLVGRLVEARLLALL